MKLNFHAQSDISGLKLSIIFNLFCSNNFSLQISDGRFGLMRFNLDVRNLYIARKSNIRMDMVDTNKTKSSFVEVVKGIWVVIYFFILVYMIGHSFQEASCNLLPWQISLPDIQKYYSILLRIFETDNGSDQSQWF